MHALSTVLVTKQALAVAIAATAILGGGLVAEASQITAAGAGHAGIRVASQAGADTALDALATIRADVRAGGGLKSALGGITPHGAAAKTEARLDARTGDQRDPSIGERVRVEAHSRIGSMQQFVLGLLGIQTGAGAQVAVGDGTETARAAVAIGSGQSHAALTPHAATDTTGGLSTALDGSAGLRLGLSGTR